MAASPGTARLLGLAEQAEGLGYDAVWVGDSLFSRSRHEPLTLLAGVAASTTRVRLGTAVLLPALRNPVVLAQIVATLDRLAEGRLVLGCGVAPDSPGVRAEFAAAGVPFEQRVGRFVHGLRLCRELWSGNAVTWDGPYWSVTAATQHPTPHRAGGPPIWVGGSVAATLERTGRLFDGWFPVGGEVEGFIDGLTTVRSAAAAAGRPADAVTAASYVTMSIDPDTVKAEATLLAFLGEYYSPVPSAAMRRGQNCYAGPLDGAFDYLRRFADAGAGHLCLRFVGEHEANLERFATWSY